MTDSTAIRDQEAEYRAFLLEFRMGTGRPMTSLEEALAHMAYASGFAAGVDWAYRDVIAHMPVETEAG